jgi:hypothetical protein
MIIFGVFAQVIRLNILTFDEGVETMKTIAGSIFILRLSFVCDLMQALFYLLTAWALFNILKHFNKNQSLLFLILTVVAVAVYSANMLNHIAIIELNSTNYLHLGTNELKSATRFYTNLHEYGYLISQLFFGLWLFPVGIIVLQSKIMPKYFGVMLIAATVGALTEFFIMLLFPGNEIVTYPGLVLGMTGEFSFCFWLLYKGLGKVNEYEKNT